MVMRVAYMLQVQDNVLEYVDRVRKQTLQNVRKTYLCKRLRFKTIHDTHKVVEFDLEESMCQEVDPSVDLFEARERGFFVLIDELSD